MDHDPVRVVLYTVPGLCPLCDEAREQLVRAGVCFDEVDIRSDRDLLREYRNEIPVVTLDGRKIAYGRIGPAQLAQLPQNVQHPPGPSERRKGVTGR